MDVISRIKTLLLVLVQGIINIISCFVQKREKRLHIPRPNNGIVYTSATKLVERIRKKQISCEEIILAYIQRIEEINPVINAVVESRFAESIIEARKADEFLNSLSPFDIDILPHIKPLLGIPITVKESLGVKGLSFTGCSLTRNDIKAFEDADVIKLLKEAGAIILLVSNTSEYCSSIETSNKVIGRTRNPYDTRRSSGGSSGGEISCEELVTTYIQRIQKVNPIINAVVEDRFREALVEAKEADKYLQRVNSSTVNLAKEKPLLGIPITVKESVSVKGLSLTACSLTRKGKKATKDAEVITLLKEAGAIILLVSSTPEYFSAIDTANNVIGRSKNPYDTRHSVGGSSGGEGALLGAGASVIGVGTDIGGSIRLPSAFNCIYGHKPTPGTVPLDGSFPWSDDPRFSEYLTTGPMTRYVEDLKLALKVMGGVNAKKLNLDQEVDFRSINVSYMFDFVSDFGLLKVDKRVKTAIKQAVSHLSKSLYGCHVVESSFYPYMDDTLYMAEIVFKVENSPNAFTDSEIKYSPIKEFIKFLFGKSIFTFNTFLAELLGISKMGPKEKFQPTLDKVAKLKNEFIKSLGDNGVFLYPSFSTEAFKHNQSFRALTGARFLPIANVFGCPATNVPIGLNENGLPLGIQVIAGPNQDNLCLEVAKVLDTYFGGWQRPY